MNLLAMDKVPDAALTALVYRADGVAEPGAAPLLSRLAESLCQRGLRVAGVIEHLEDNPDGPCDVRLEVLGARIGAGNAIALSASRGRGARGCRLDTDALMRAVSLTQAALEAGADILIINKFGKMEAEGSGFRPVLADAVMRGIPVVIGVPARNLDAFRVFAGEMAVEVMIGAAHQNLASAAHVALQQQPRADS